MFEDFGEGNVFSGVATHHLLHSCIHSHKTLVTTEQHFLHVAFLRSQWNRRSVVPFCNCICILNICCDYICSLLAKDSS